MHRRGDSCVAGGGCQLRTEENMDLFTDARVVNVSMDGDTVIGGVYA